MIGAEEWNIYKAEEVPPQSQLGGLYWPNEEEEEFAKAIFHAFFAPRQKILEENNGRLVAKGTAHADRLGMEAVVEGSEAGRRLYQSEGFDGPFSEVPFPEKFADRRKQVYYLMRRTAKTVILGEKSFYT